MVDSSIWDQEIDVPEDVISYVDSNVSANMPPMSRVEGISPHGASYWTRTAEIQTTQEDGSPLSFFLKVSQNDTGKGMMSGEFASMSALHNTMPDLAPKPIAWGTYASNPNIHFFLCSFHDMTDEVPDVEVFPAKIAELHMKGVSPNGKFGFPVVTYQGRLPQDTTWCDTWEECFSRSLKRMLELEEEAQGYNEKMSFLSNAIMTKVIPRLLRPLETEGHQIQPRLVHGDLWDGNTSTDVVTDNPLIFDASAFYAHNEYELGPWRPTRHKIGKSYVHVYHKHFPISAPEEDFDDRNTLYCIRFNMCSSALYPGNIRFRNIVMEEMQVLVDKFPDGYEGWLKQRKISLGD
ncbi:hypothetical protein GP486_001941 [Trichoglossum hirsutum]|uniref:protein-ribulosamine 3-kinase n=1 Tax=Trichoglossum hirsutum TaxID=265104 RepID=A0A9P8LG56_9PEZI|nr:hypothetical protein GP486_001941 [Trichoglossum hirsutum]